MHKQDGRRKHLGWVEAALRAANPDLPLLKISAQSHDGPADHVAFVDVYGIDADSDRRRNIRSNANDLLFRLGQRPPTNWLAALGVGKAPKFAPLTPMRMLHSGILKPAIVRVQHFPIFNSSSDVSAIATTPSAPASTGERAMTYAENLTHPGNWLRDWFEASRATATERRARRSAYLQTLHALQSMPDRDLADIGLSRLSIKEVAHEAAYGGARP